MVSLELEEWLAPPWYTQRSVVTKARFTSFRPWLLTTRWFENNAPGSLINQFPDPVTQVFFRLGYPPTALVQLEEGKPPVVLEDPLVPDYVSPSFSFASVSFTSWFGDTFSRAGDAKEVKLQISFPGHLTTYTGSVGRLEDYSEELSSVDFLGFPFEFSPLLAEHGVKLSRVPVKLDLHAPSRIEEEVARLIEWSRVSFVPPAVLSGKSIGHPLTANEARFALKRKLIFEKRFPSRIERWKGMDELRLHDRGGVVFRPPPGVYFDVAQLDFSSMYPRIICEWNISPETVNANDSLVAVPETVHLVTPKSVRTGVVPDALEWLVNRKETLSRLSVTRPQFKVRKDALKWILVASFGYLGFRNAIFGKLEAYECVTGVSRYTVRKAVRIAQKMGFQVLHVMVDSIFVSGANHSYDLVAKAITKETGIPIRTEAVYDWVVFSKNKQRPEGSPARYFGRLNTGAIKVKGLDMVKRNVPEIVKRTQARAISVLASARTRDEFYDLQNEVVRLFEDEKKALVRGLTPPKELTFRIRGRTLIKGFSFYDAEGGTQDIDRDYYLCLLDRAMRQVVLGSPTEATPVLGFPRVPD